jgi:hypothetical protein
MMIVGPSHAGKSTLLRLISTNPEQFGLLQAVVHLNLDGELGSKHRSDGQWAREIIESHNGRQELVLADCGAGQVAFSADFRGYILEDLQRVAAVWCDIETFRSRHSPETVEREIEHNYGSEVGTIWECARRLDNLVDTSIGISEFESATHLAAIVSRTSNQRGSPIG